MTQYKPGRGNLGGNTFSGWKRKTETLSAAGTYASPTKTLTAAESGLILLCNIGTASVVVQLPSAEAGLHYRVVQIMGSDNEATYDLAVTTGSDSVNMGGNVMEGGSVKEITSGTSVIIYDSSASSKPATVGDWLEFECDGTDWYVRGNFRYASVVIHDDYDGVTIP